MRNIMTRTLAFVGAVAMLGSVVACGSTNSSDSGDENTGEITFWTKNLKTGYNDYFVNLVKEFEKQNPGAKVKWVDQPGESYANTVSTAAASGTLPDVLDGMPSDAFALAEAGAIDNVSKEYPNTEKEYAPGPWSGMVFKSPTIEEGAYGYPWYTTSSAIFYNKGILAECGVDTTNLPDSYDEYFAAADTFAQNCKGKYSFDANLPNIGGFYAYAGKQLNDDRTKWLFNNKKSVELLQKYADMYKNGALSEEAVSANGTQSSDLFKQGAVATRSGYVYDLQDIKENAPEVYKNLAFVPGFGHASITPEMLMVSSTSKKKALAHKFAQFVTNNKNQVEFGKAANVFPATAEGVDDPYFTNPGADADDQRQLIATLSKNIKDGFCGYPEFTPADSTTFTEQVSLAASGKVSPKEALDTAVNDANTRLQD